MIGLFRTIRMASLMAGISVSMLAIVPVPAQQPSVVHGDFNNQARVTLQGNVSSLTGVSKDIGKAPDSEPTGTMMLVLGRSAAGQMALDTYVKSAAIVGSPNYHQWLTPDAYGRQFGPSDSDVHAVRAWLRSQGFEVEPISPAGNVVRFSGSMGALRAAFGTEIHSYAVGSEVHLANATEPTVPAAFATLIRGIAPLNDLRPRSLAVRAPQAAPKTNKQGGVHPNLTIYGPTQWNSGAGGYDVYYLPGAGDAAVLYDLPNPAMNPSYAGALYTGSGVKIGIAADSNLSANAIANIANYRSVFLNESLAYAKAAPQLPTVVVDGNDPGTTGDEFEAMADVEMVSAFAPGALTTVYASADTDLQYGLFLAIQRAVNDNQVDILNVSFGSCEQLMGAGTNALINEMFEQAAAEGISVTVASGDEGSGFCGYGNYGMAVNGLASTPWNIAVGGTDFDVLFTTDLKQVQQYIDVPVNPTETAAKAPYWNSAKGYIPEGPWNNSTTVFKTADQNVQYKWGNGIPLSLAGGGGMSSAAVCSGSVDSGGNCSGSLSGYAKPSYQSSLTPKDGVRDLPDVSFFSGAFEGDEGYSQNFNVGWSICSDSVVDGNTSMKYTDCVPSRGTAACGGTCDMGTDTTTTPVGGTSLSSPAMAGILALVMESQGGARLGQANYGIYNLAASHPEVFHDVTQGNNAVGCVAGTMDCGPNNFLTGYNAGPGYDLATGFGSLDVAKFISKWPTVKFAATTSTLQAGTSPSSLGTGPLTLQHGATVYLKVSMTPLSATGNVVLVSDSQSPNSASIGTATLSNGIASFNTQAFPGGIYTVHAVYSGDASNASSQSQTIRITVSPEASTTKVDLNVYDPQYLTETGASPSSATYGSLFYVNVTPYGVTEGLAKGNPATGAVVLSLDAKPLATVTLGSSRAANYVVDAKLLTPGAHTITAAYPGDGSYNPSTGVFLITITKASLTNPTVWPEDGWVWQITDSASANIQWAEYTAGVVPTGTVTIALNGNILKSADVTTSKASGYVVGVGSGVSVSPSQIGVGNSATFTMTYSGDDNYAGVSFTTHVSVAEPTGAIITLSNSGNINIASAGQPGTTTLTLTPSNGFGGPVTLACKETNGPSTTYVPTCTVAASVTISGTAAQTTSVSVSTTAPKASAVKSSHVAMLFGGAGVTLGGLMLFAVPRRRRAWLVTGMLLLAVAVLLPTGCGGGGSGPGNGGGGITAIPGTASGTYAFTITGTSGPLSGTTSFNVVVP